MLVCSSFLETPDSKTTLDRPATVARDDGISLLWENGKVLKYCFLSGFSQQRNKVVFGMREWERHANIHFEETQYRNDSDIRITFNTCHGLWSSIGKQNENLNKRTATMNLSHVTNLDKFTDRERGIILHELGHSIGLGHEHKSSETGGRRLAFKRDETLKYFGEEFGCTVEEVEYNVLNAYAIAEVNTFPNLDSKSIMRCFIPAELNEEGIKVAPNIQLSDLDKAYATILYPPHPQQTYGKDMLKQALETAGVLDQLSTKILEYYNQSVLDIRAPFAEWCQERFKRNLKETSDREDKLVETHPKIDVKRLPTIGSDSESSRTTGVDNGGQQRSTTGKSAVKAPRSSRSPEVQAIIDGFIRIGGPAIFEDPRMAYGMIPRAMPDSDED